jgi:hypothetical protein
MAEKEGVKEKMKKIYDTLPKLDDQRCGYRTCGEFARAVAAEKAPCYGCVSGGPEVAARVCEIMGAKVPQDAIVQFAPSAGPYQPSLSGGWVRGRRSRPGLRRGRGHGRGRGGGMGHGFGRGRRGS